MHDFTQRLRALVAHEHQPVRAEVPKVGGDDKVAVIRLYDPIDWIGGNWGVSAKEFVAALDEIPDGIEEIRLHINSPGGDVFDGIAILNALRSYDARVVAVVDSLAASAASFIAAGADELVMARNSQLMIHDAWGLVIGNADDMREMAELLDRQSDNIASIYAEKAGGDVAEWRAAMARETWYSADEAVEAGLADRVDKKSEADTKNEFDLSIFKYAGRQEAPAPTAAVTNDERPDRAPADAATSPDGAPVTPPENAAEDEERERQRQRLRAWQLTGTAS